MSEATHAWRKRIGAEPTRNARTIHAGHAEPESAATLERGRYSPGSDGKRRAAEQPEAFAAGEQSSTRKVTKVTK